MKKSLILIISSCLLIFTLNAQNFSLGPSIGMNMIPMEDNGPGQNFQIGVHAGLQVKYKISNIFSLSSGAFYSQKKQNYDYMTVTPLTEELSGLFGFLDLGDLGIEDLGLEDLAIDGVNLDVNKDVNAVANTYYAEIPLMANFHFSNFNIYLGPYAGYLTNVVRNESIHTTTPLFNLVDLSSFDDTGLLTNFLPPADEYSTFKSTSNDNITKFNYGANFGIGYAMNNLNFNLFYSLGLKDYTIDSTLAEGDGKHHNFRISLAYLFPIKKKNKLKSTNNL